MIMVQFFNTINMMLAKYDSDKWLTRSSESRSQGRTWTVPTAIEVKITLGSDTADAVLTLEVRIDSICPASASGLQRYMRSNSPWIRLLVEVYPVKCLTCVKLNYVVRQRFIQPQT